MLADRRVVFVRTGGRGFRAALLCSLEEEHSRLYFLLWRDVTGLLLRQEKRQYALRRRLLRRLHTPTASKMVCGFSAGYGLAVQR